MRCSVLRSFCARATCRTPRDVRVLCERAVRTQTHTHGHVWVVCVHPTPYAHLEAAAHYAMLAYECV